MAYNINPNPNSLTAVASGDKVKVLDVSDTSDGGSNGLEKAATVASVIAGGAGLTAGYSTEGPTNDVDVTNISVITVDTSSNSVTFGGFTGGVAGQVLHIVRLDTTNNLVLEHNEGTGNQDIFLHDEADATVTTYGGFILVCDGSNWYECGDTVGN